MVERYGTGATSQTVWYSPSERSRPTTPQIQSAVAPTIWYHTQRKRRNRRNIKQAIVQRNFLIVVTLNIVLVIFVQDNAVIFISNRLAKELPAFG